MRIPSLLSAPLAAVLLVSTQATAQVSAYTFSAEAGIWQPLNGAGALLGMPGMPPMFNLYDDNSFVTQGESILLSTSATGNGWPIGFTFTFNGHPYDRVGLSIEGWLAFGNSSDGTNAVHVPIGADAYVPLSSSLPAGVDPLKRDRIAGFAMDLAAQGSGGIWPLQLITRGVAPNRAFIVEWNLVRSGGSSPLSFQVRLNEGGGDPAAQTVQVIYGNMPQSTAMLGQVGLGGHTAADFNNRSVTASPYDWMLSQAGATNTATCRLPSTAANLPQGLTFTWTPPGCLVTGIAVTDLAISAGNITATLSWTALTGADSYDYLITAGGPNDPAILSGTGITATSVALSGLPLGQPMFAYVRADCGSGVADWGAGTTFSTEGLTEVICGEAPLAYTHCYGNLEEKTWSYTASSGEPLRLSILSGSISNGDLLLVHDGPTAQAPLVFSSANGDIAGQVFISSGPHLTMKLITDDNGSCMTQEFIPPMEWEVGCMDCDPVLANFNVQTDCADGHFNVEVAIFSLGSADLATITNNGGAPEVTASAAGSYTVGPFPIGTPVIVRAENAYNDYCSAVSMGLLNSTCPVVDCGPTVYDHCYTNNDEGQWGYQSDDNGRIGIRFTSGTLLNGDIIRIYDGLDPIMSVPLFSGDNGGNLNGLMVITNATNPDHALLLEAVANGSGSCATGQATPWEYVVACYDGCTPPQATYTTVPDCDNGQFSINVELSTLGSAASVTVTNDAGAAPVVMQAAGTAVVGPFDLGTPVVVNVEGSSMLCTVNSDFLTETCEVGIHERIEEELRVYPNPGDGYFQLVMPKGFGQTGRLEVRDLTGRTMAWQVLGLNGGQGVHCSLGHLPAGTYLLTVTGERRVALGRLTIVH